LTPARRRPTLKPKRVIDSPTRSHPVHIDLEGIADDGLGYTVTIYADRDYISDGKSSKKTWALHSTSMTSSSRAWPQEKKDDVPRVIEEVKSDKDTIKEYRVSIQKPPQALDSNAEENITSALPKGDDWDKHFPLASPLNIWKDREHAARTSRYSPQGSARLKHLSPSNPVNVSNAYLWHSPSTQ
jgi:hypothetical protein